MADDATAAFEAAKDDWGIAAGGLIRAMGAAHAGVSTVTETASVARRHSDAVGYDAFRAPVLLLEAWAAEGRGEDAAAVDAYRRAFELAGRIGFGDHAASARRTRSDRSRERRSAQGRGSSGRRLRRRAAAQATLVAAQARVHLARIAAASGNTDEADRLYREVIEWSTMQRRTRRESLFVALAGDPATAAERGLAEIAEPRPDTALT